MLFTSVVMWPFSGIQITMKYGKKLKDDKRSIFIVALFRKKYLGYILWEEYSSQK